MHEVVSSLMTGISLGGTYALVILGIVLANRGTGTLSFAHGELIVVGAFVTGWALAGGQGLFVAIVLGVAVTAVLAAGFYQFALRATVGLPEFMGVIATLGFAAMLAGLVAVVFGTTQFTITFPGLSGSVVTIAGVQVEATSAVVGVAGIVIASVIAAALRFTQIGTQIRAAGQDVLLASQGGINVKWVFVGSWAASGALAALAGIGYGSSTIVTVDLSSLLFAAVPALILGGLDSIIGALVGSLILGLVQGFTATYLGGEELNMISYLLLLVMMLVRPSGLFGSRSSARI